MFGKRIREIRLKRGYTQQFVADSLNITLRAYQKYEQGVREPAYDILVQIADLYVISTDYLLGRDEFMKVHGVSFDE